MLRYWVLLVVLLGLASLQSGVATAQMPFDDGTYISGGPSPDFGPVRLAAADHDALRRRIDAPPKLEEEPRAQQPAYSVYSSYWREVAESRAEGDPSDAVYALYYPLGGYAHVHRDKEDDFWVVMDLRQRAILDRYIRLVERRSFLDAPRNERSPVIREPGIFDVMKAAVRGEDVGIQIGGHELTLEQASKFWLESIPLTLRRGLQVSPAQAKAEPATWVLFTLPEGRTVPMHYSLGSGLLMDATGTDVYPAPARWLEPVLGSRAVPGSPDYDLAPASIAQDEGAGSPLWWVLMLGAGVACIGAAVWLSRQLLSRSDQM